MLGAAMLLGASPGAVITPSVDGLGGALGQYIAGDGGLASQAGGLGVLPTLLLAVLALLLGVLATRPAGDR